MDLADAQRQAQRLIALSASAPNTEEGRTAGAKACQIIAQYGLLLMKPGDNVSYLLPAPAATASSGAKPKRKRKPKETLEQVRAASTVVVETLDAAGRVMGSFNNFRHAIRGGR